MMDLLQRYNRPAPRYTSYPPAPHWHSAGEDLLIRAVETSARPLSIYTHIPFCERLCLYCGCNVIISKNHSVAVPYIERLIAEMDLLKASHGRIVNQIHWGGGTPTYLDCDQISTLYNAIAERFRVAADAEISVEVDPRVTTREQLSTLRSLGFGRLSLGIQDFDETVQKAVHRIQPFPMTHSLIDYARAIGFDSINVDLIYGLPLQTRSGFEKTLQLVQMLNPDRIAVFSYAHVPSIKRQQRALEKRLPTDGEKLELFVSAIQFFSSHGYEHIGMDHFARPSDPLAKARLTRSLHRNFQGYTTHAETDLVAFGLTAISQVGNTFTQNHRESPLYNEAIEHGRLPVFRGYERTEDDRIRGAVIENVLCNNVVAKDEIEAAFGIQFDSYFHDSLERLAEFERDGLVEGADSRQIRVTGAGRVFIRTVAQVFDAFQTGPVASKAV